MNIEPGAFVEITSGPDAGFCGIFECEWINPQGQLVYVVLANPSDDDGDFWYAPSIKRA